MKKKFLMLMIYIMPVIVFAQANEHVDYVETTKYFKTVHINAENSVSTFSKSFPLSYSIEVSKEEYEKNNSDKKIGLLDIHDGFLETTYKKMTTTIRKINDTTFRYAVNLFWKTMPSTRSYDIIGIGFPSSVKTESQPVFEQNYCLNSGECRKTSIHTPYIGVNGVGASFILPSGNIYSLSQDLYIDVVKTNTSSTILKQNAYGDYSHAQKSLSSINSKNYIVNINGIVLDSSIYDYYDHINVANAWWTGRW